jgi:hypothetical protein
MRRWIDRWRKVALQKASGRLSGGPWLAFPIHQLTSWPKPEMPSASPYESAKGIR